MGARAHGRRHEGRRIRRSQRRWREAVAAFGEMGRLAERVGRQFGEILSAVSATVRTIDEQNRIRQERQQGLLALAEARTDNLPSDGVEAGTAHSREVEHDRHQ